MNDVTFFLIRTGLPNTAAVLCLAVLPLLALGL